MKQGFTLSEVLITLGVVGVVAVLTIPGVMKNYHNRLYTTQLQKVYAQVTDAVQSIMNDEHVDNFYETSAGGENVCNENTKECTKGLAYFLQNYFKITKSDCLNETESCLSNNYRSVGGTSIPTISGNHYAVQTITGAVIGGFYNNANKCTSLFVDVNGTAEPNVAGRDVFAMDIRSNGTIADYQSGCSLLSSGSPAEACTRGDTRNMYSAAAGCLNNVIEAGWKMEY